MGQTGNISVSLCKKNEDEIKNSTTSPFPVILLKSVQFFMQIDNWNCLHSFLCFLETVLYSLSRELLGYHLYVTLQAHFPCDSYHIDLLCLRWGDGDGLEVTQQIWDYCQKWESFHRVKEKKISEIYSMKQKLIRYCKK